MTSFLLVFKEGKTFIKAQNPRAKRKTQWYGALAWLFSVRKREFLVSLTTSLGEGMDGKADFSHLPTPIV